MIISKRSLVALAVLAGAAVVVPACSKDSDKSESSERARNQGDLNFAITVDGVTLNSVSYAVTNAANNITGTINVSQPGSTISAEVGVPAGTGYTATLSATAEDGGVVCSGTSTTFDVGAGQEVAVGITLRCTRDGVDLGSVRINADASVENCPTIGAYAVSPLQVDVGGTIALTSTAVGAGATTTWSEGATTIATTPNATYTCAVAGPHTLTLTVGATPATPACAEAKTIDVVCSTGGGGTGGTSGTGGAAGTGGSTAGTGGSTAGTGGVAGTAGTGGGANACLTCLQSNCAGPLGAVTANCTSAAPCTALQNCFDTSDCDEINPVSCYCGDVDPADCFALATPDEPPGVCREQIQDILGQTLLPTQIAPLLTNTGNRVGANVQLSGCNNRSCLPVCPAPTGPRT